MKISKKEEEKGKEEKKKNKERRRVPGLSEREQYQVKSVPRQKTQRYYNNSNEPSLVLILYGVMEIFSAYIMLFYLSVMQAQLSPATTL